MLFITKKLRVRPSNIALSDALFECDVVCVLLRVVVAQRCVVLSTYCVVCAVDEVGGENQSMVWFAHESGVFRALRCGLQKFQCGGREKLDAPT
jgi:hypothetical protein